MEKREYYSYANNQPKNQEKIILKPFNSIKPCKENYNSNSKKETIGNPNLTFVSSKPCTDKNKQTNAWVGIL